MDGSTGCHNAKASIVQELCPEPKEHDPANDGDGRLGTLPEDLRTLESGNGQHFKPYEVAKPMNNGEQEQHRSAKGHGLGCES